MNTSALASAAGGLAARKPLFERIGSIGGATALAVFGAVSLLVAIVLPYRSWDSFAFGAWSRGIADTGDFHAPGGFLVAYQRPLYYVLQGWIWRATGFHVWEGRLLSLLFSALLVGAVIVLARRVLRLSVLGAIVAGLVVALIPDFQVAVAGGLSDVPAAAMVAAAAAATYLLRRSPFGAVAVVVISALAVVSKSTAIVALGAFVVAELIAPRAELRARALRVAPVAAGCALGFAYFLAEAHREQLGVSFFLRAGTDGSWAQLADQTRHDELLRIGFLGADLRLLLVFAVAYALLRIVSSPHRIAAFAAAPVAVAVSWILPALATGGQWSGPFAGGASWNAAGYVVLALLLPVAGLAPAAPGRLVLARLLVWALPVLVLWYENATYATRLVSPSWAPFALLIALAVMLVADGCRTLAAPAVLAPVTVLVVLLVVALPNVDGLRGEQWDAFWNAGPSGWTDGHRMRALGLGAIDDELRVVDAQAGPDGRVRSTDARLRFWLGPNRVDTVPATSCGSFGDARVFVLLLDPSSASTMESAAPGSSSPDFWAKCGNLVPVWQIPYAFAAYTVGAPRDASPAACDVPPRPSGLVAVFGDKLSLADANALRDRAVAVNFRQAIVERSSCGAFAVVMRGFSGDANAQDFAKEATAAGFPVKIETLP